MPIRTPRSAHAPIPGTPLAILARAGDDVEAALAALRAWVERALPGARCRVVEGAAPALAPDARACAVHDGPDGPVAHVVVEALPPQAAAVADEVLAEAADAVAVALRQQRLAREAHQARRSLFTFLESTPGALVRLDAQGRHVYVNPAAAEDIPGGPAAVLGRTIPETPVSPEFALACVEAVERARATGRAVPLALSYGEGDARRWYDCMVVPERDETGRVSGFHVHTADVTERHRAEAAMRDALAEAERARREAEENERLLRRIADLSPGMIYLIDHATGRILYIGSQLAHRIGDPEALRGASREAVSAELVHPDDRRIAAEAYERVATLPDDAVDEFTCRLRTRDGGWCWVRSQRVVFSRDAEGRPRLVLGLAVDETANRDALAALQRSEELFRLASSVTTDLLYDWRPDGEAIHWNGALRALVGDADDLPPADAHGFVETPFAWWEERVHPDERAVVTASLGAAVAGAGETWSADYRFRRSDGTWAWVHDSARILRDARGNARRVIGAMLDRTETELLERRTRQMQKLEALGTLAGGIAHEVNNALAAILGFAELGQLELDDPALPQAAELRHMLGEIVAAARHGRDVVRQILVFSRQTEPVRERVDLCELLEDAVRRLRRTLPGHVDVVLRMDVERPALVQGGRAELEQVIANLLSNAEWALRGVEVARLAIVLEALADERGWRLTVVDTGVGMSEATLERAFEPFFTTRPEAEGTGMGLSVAHGIVTKLGGTIELDSSVGVGTTATVRLPRAGERGGAATAPVAIAHRVLAREGGADARRVLVIDDDALVAAFVARELEEQGYEVVASTDAHDAVELVRAAGPGAFHFVIGDQMMPGLAPDALMHALRAVDPTLPVVLMTGASYRISPARARDLGVAAVLQKPLVPEALLETLARVAEPDGES